MSLKNNHVVFNAKICFGRSTTVAVVLTFFRYTIAYNISSLLTLKTDLYILLAKNIIFYVNCNAIKVMKCKKLSTVVVNNNSHARLRLWHIKCFTKIQKGFRSTNNGPNVVIYKNLWRSSAKIIIGRHGIAISSNIPHDELRSCGWRRLQESVFS